MQQFNALRRFFPQFPGGQVPVGMQQPFNPMNQFNPMPFEGGMQDPGKGGFYGQFSGPFNVPNSGMGVPNQGAPRNALMGFGGYRGSGMGIRQKY